MNFKPGNHEKTNLAPRHIVFTLAGKSQSCVTIPTTYLKINNNRNCDITVNYEVSDCNGACPLPVANYCNSSAQTGVGTGTFVIPAGTTFTIDISLQNFGSGSSGNCSWYGGGTSDVEVNLFGIDYTPPTGGRTVYGRVAAACLCPTYDCSNVLQTDSGDNSTGNPAPNPGATGTCVTANNAWSMQWQTTSFGVVVDIN